MFIDTNLVQFLGIFSFLFITCFRYNSTFRYYAKFGIYYGSVIILAALYLPYFIYKWKNVLNILYFAEKIKYVTKIVGIKWTLRGVEHLSKNKSLIIVANHQTSLDILGMFNVWHSFKLLTVIAKKELMYVPMFGLAAYLSDIIFIDRRSARAKESMNKAMTRLKEKNIKLWIFPEGTRRNTRMIHDFKKGAFHTAIQEQIPIVPVVFSSYQHFIDKKQKIFNDGEIIITALPEISTQGMSFDDIDKLIEKVRGDMTEVYNSTTSEVISFTNKNDN